MSRNLIILRGLRAVTVVVLGVGLVFSLTAWGQDQQPLSYTPSTAIEQEKSRAQSEAEQTVSLSADQIVNILDAEPGLMLEIKKALVRKAFEEGRVLDRQDLTDDGVYRLIREDEDARVVATKQIEDRSYVRAKPTRDEIAKNLPCRAPLTTDFLKAQQQKIPDATSASSALQALQDHKAAPSQEQLYWAEHENDLDCYLTQYLPLGTAQSLYPLTSANGQVIQAQQQSQQQGTNTPQNQQRYPQTTYPFQNPGQYPQQQYQPNAPSQYGPQQPYTPSQPQLNFTQMQEPPQGYFGMETEEDEMLDIQPAELSSMMSASQAGSGSFQTPGGGMSSMSGGGGLSGGMTLPTSLGSSSMGSMGSSGGGALSSLTGSSPFGMLGGGSFFNSSPFSTQGSLENQTYPGMMQFPPPKEPQQPRLYHRPNPYSDIPSLYDLYAQYPRHTHMLERFGDDVFVFGSGNLAELPMDMPVGPDYVVGPGDGLSVDMWGGVSEKLIRVVDREGLLALPEVGAVQVSGKTLGEIQHQVQTILRGQFRNVGADVSLAHLRTIRVYIVGDVERPGAYDVSSLSTALNALYQAGGPTSSGSMRRLEHYRGKQLIETVDVYDLLLHGINGNIQRLEPGDTLRVPPLQHQVTIQGMVRRPAIYELNGETNLSQVLELAGGVLPTGTLRHVDVERIESHESRTMLRLDIPETNDDASVAKALEDFKVQDGDKIRITPILPYADKTVYLDGHVSRPGKFAYTEGMKVSDLIKSYRDLLPEPSISHAEIIRLSQPDFTPVVLAFNLGDALAGKDSDFVLKPFDTVRVFGKYDFEDPPVITITGEVRDPGDHLTNGLPHLRDAIYLAGGTTRDALLDDAQVFRKTSDGKLAVLSVNLARAMEGDEKDNIPLEPRDRVFVNRALNKVDPATVIISGEVGRPGKYPLGDGMTAAGLVRLAGGFKRGAYTDEADLTSYMVENGQRIVSDHQTVQIARAMVGEPDTDVRLHDGDVLTIREISGWQDLGATIEVKGEVAHPGGYGIEPGERLSSILKRAGGFTALAYPYGAVFERVELRDLEEKNHSDLIQMIRAEQAQLKIVPGMEQDDQTKLKATMLIYQKAIDNLENTPPVGRLVIHISSNIAKWANTPADIQVRAGDRILVPKKAGMVLVDGSVYNPTGISYKPGKNAGWYLMQAGGPTTAADRRSTFVIRADGSVVGGAGGLFSGGVEHAELRAGDMVMVPQKNFYYGTKFKSTLQAAQLATSVGIAAYYVGHF
jgi:protein involved in polysaccharide export with SLBB domain